MSNTPLKIIQNDSYSGQRLVGEFPPELGAAWNPAFQQHGLPTIDSWCADGYKLRELIALQVAMGYWNQGVGVGDDSLPFNPWSDVVLPLCLRLDPENGVALAAELELSYSEEPGNDPARLSQLYPWAGSWGEVIRYLDFEKLLTLQSA